MWVQLPISERLNSIQLTIYATDSHHQNCIRRDARRVGIFYDCFRRIMDPRIDDSRPKELTTLRRLTMNPMLPLNSCWKRIYHSWIAINEEVSSLFASTPQFSYACTMAPAVFFLLVRANNVNCLQRRNSFLKFWRLVWLFLSVISLLQQLVMCVMRSNPLQLLNVKSSTQVPSVDETTNIITSS